MSAVATRAALVVPAARGASGGRARSSGVSRPRRRTAARRRPDCASSATRPSAASASLDDGEDDDEGNPTTDVTSPSRSADGKQPVPSPTSRLSNVCFVLCRPQGPANVGGIARVMNNFGITDLRVVAPEPGALAPPFDALMDDGSDRAIHSAKDRSTAPFADEARIMAVHAAHLLLLLRVLRVHHVLAPLADRAGLQAPVVPARVARDAPRQHLVALRDARLLRHAEDLGPVRLAHPLDADPLGPLASQLAQRVAQGLASHSADACGQRPATRGRRSQGSGGCFSDSPPCCYGTPKAKAPMASVRVIGDRWSSVKPRPRGVVDRTKACGNAIVAK